MNNQRDLQGEDMKKIYKDIPEGGLIPKWYGVAWRAEYNLKVRCYPIPLNIIIRIARHLWCELMHGCFRSKWEGKLLDAYLDGKYGSNPR